MSHFQSDVPWPAATNPISLPPRPFPRPNGLQGAVFISVGVLTVIVVLGIIFPESQLVRTLLSSTRARPILTDAASRLTFSPNAPPADTSSAATEPGGTYVMEYPLSKRATSACVLPSPRQIWPNADDNGR